jgi:predicted DNA-binding antitoxin AbrB/MazE fold protein
MRMTIAATYEHGVFKPLEEVKLPEGAKVEVTAPKRAKFVSNSLPAHGRCANQ